MKLFGRRTALSTSASFQGIGGAPVAAKPKGDDDMETKETKEDDTKAGATPAPASASKEEKDGDDDDDNDDDDDEDGNDGSDETDMKGGKKAKKVASARLRERARIATIMQHPKAAAHPDFALKMALTTGFGRDKICSMLDALPASATTNTLTARMSTEANRHVGSAPASPSRAAAIDAGWDRAAKKALHPFATT